MVELDALLNKADSLLSRLENLYLPPEVAPDWEKGIAFRWQKNGRSGFIQAVSRPTKIHLNDLLGIDDVKQAIIRNTCQFIHGLPANHTLIWGPRGTGKSSLIRALINEFHSDGLRLIEVYKRDLADLTNIVDHLCKRDERFIIYCDDLSFESNDPSYKDLKVLLDGTSNGLSENVLIYATSNRRHLIPEYFRENLDAKLIDGEIHHHEAVEEKIALSERFGLWLAIHPFNQETYLHIVDHWLGQMGVTTDTVESVHQEALQWALRHGSRSGRSAIQFACDWAGQKELAAINGHSGD